MMRLLFRVFKKLVEQIPTLLGVWLLVFVLFHAAGGDPALMILGQHASAERLTQVRHELGFDLPLWKQLGVFLWDSIRFEYGVSYQSRQPVLGLILSGLGPSLLLMLPALMLTTVLSMGLGLWAASMRSRWPDRLLMVCSVLGMSVSILVYILAGQYFLAFRAGWFPIHGFEGNWIEKFQSLLLPILIWVGVSVGYDVRYYRTIYCEEVNREYIRTARAKGVSEKRIFFHHLLGNSWGPVITNLLMQMPLLILGNFLLESYFGIPGLGSLTVNAIQNSDFPVIRAMTSFLAFCFLISQVVMDGLYAWVDPRVREGMMTEDASR